MSEAFEVNFDGLVGPTHHYAGLSAGNLASTIHARQVSNPRDAALQGLAKMRLMVSLGLKQGILLPHPRPCMPVLKQLGFMGDEQQLLEMLYKKQPALFMAIFSASSMWTANSATITPSSDTADQKVHITPANLSTFFHRAIEADFNQRLFQTMFPDTHFVVHNPLPYGATLSDEGAANHTRLCEHYGAPGIHLYVYGREALNSTAECPKKFPARQTLEASETIARLHETVTPCYFIQQNPKVIDAGVFHNDVIAVGNENVFLYHEDAYLDDFDLPRGMQVIPIAAKQMSVKTAVESYFFNSQLVTIPNDGMMLIMPEECEENKQASRLVKQLLQEDNPIARAEFIDLRQSMHNGGGPACTRLRVVMNEAELRAMHPHFLVDEHMIGLLESWVQKHYRDRLTVKDFLDKDFRASCDDALSELVALLDVPNVY